MIGEPKPPGSRLRFGPGFPSGDAAKPEEKPKLRMRGLKVGTEKTETLFEKSAGEKLIGKILIQRDTGDRFRVFEYNPVLQLIRLEKVGTKIKVTIELDRLQRVLATEGKAWKME